jgi:NTE family protein
VDGGLPVVLSQTFRTLIHSRLELGMKGYEASHPGTDILLLRARPPRPRDVPGQPFAYASAGLAEHAYQQTRADLRSRRTALRRTLAAHGLQLDEAVLDDPARVLVKRKTKPASRAVRALKRLEEVLDDLERTLPELRGRA